MTPKRLAVALAAYGAMAAIGFATLSGKMQTGVLILLAGLAAKTLIAYMAQRR